MKKIVIFLLVAIMGTALYAQQSQPTQTIKAYCSLTAKEFTDSISTVKAIVVDVRTAKEYATGHIEGAINIVWDNNFKTSLQAANLSKEQPLAVYCRSGRRSKAAANVLVQEGYKVIALDQGILRWQQEPFPTVQ